MTEEQPTTEAVAVAEDDATKPSNETAVAAAAETVEAEGNNAADILVAEGEVNAAPDEATKIQAEEEKLEQAEAETEVDEEAEAAAEQEAAQLKAEEEAKAAVEEAEKLKAEQEAQAAEKEAARLAAEKLAQEKAEEEAKAAAEEAEKLRAEEEAKAKAAEEEAARLAAEKLAQEKAEEEAAAEKLKAEEEAKIKAEEEARLKAEADAKAKTEAEEAERLKIEQEARLRAEKLAQEQAEALKRQEEEAERKKVEEEARALAEKLARDKAELAAKKQAEEEAERAAIEEAARRRAAEKEKKAEEAAKLRAAEDKKKIEEAAKAAEDDRKRIEAEAERAAKEKEARQVAAAAQQRAMEERKEAQAKEEAVDVEPALPQSANNDDPTTTSAPKPMGLTFEGAFGDNDDDEPLVTPRSDMSSANDGFETPAQAAVSPTAAPHTGETVTSNVSAESNLTTSTNGSADSENVPPHSAGRGVSSHTALGAKSKKRVSGRMNAYLEQARKNKASELPADKPNPTASPRSKRLSFSPTNQEATASVKANERSKTPIEQRRSSLDLTTIRAKFNETAKQTSTQFVYGEAFRQKQKSLKDAVKVKDKEAVSVARGFDVMVLDAGKAQTGEVDDSHIDKTFVFQGDSEVQLHDGACKVDYKNVEYESYVFLVHRTRGLLLLKQMVNPETPRYVVPGGRVAENDFLSAAKLTGHESVQLQLAAREGAARELFSVTGIDTRNKLDRLKPAVLRTDPGMEDGKAVLKNENENKLYYFLQVEENDFPTEVVEGKTLRGPVDEPDVTNSVLRLLLDDDMEGFKFAREPQDAATYLKDHDDGKSSIALSLVMNQASDTPVPDVQTSPMAQGNEKHVPDELKEGEKSADDDVPFDEKDEKEDKSSTISQESALARAQEKFEKIQGENSPARPGSAKALEGSMANKNTADNNKSKGITYEQVGSDAGMCCGCAIQ